MWKLALALIGLVFVAVLASLGLSRRPSPNPIPPRDDNRSAPVAKPAAYESPSELATGQWASNLFLGVFSHDFGTVPWGTQPKHRFKMKNIYAVPLQITDIRHSCGCLTFSTSHADQKPLAPGEEGWVDVEVDARRFTGHKKINLYVTFGPDYVSTAVIEVVANVQADVDVNPPEVEKGKSGKAPGTAMARPNGWERKGSGGWGVFFLTRVVNVARLQSRRFSKGWLRSGNLICVSERRLAVGVPEEEALGKHATMVPQVAGRNAVRRGTIARRRPHAV